MLAVVLFSLPLCPPLPCLCQGSIAREKGKLACAVKRVHEQDSDLERWKEFQAVVGTMSMYVSVYMSLHGLPSPTSTVHGHLKRVHMCPSLSPLL